MNFHKGKIRIDPDGDYSLFTQTLPHDCDTLGVVSIGTHTIGALVWSRVNSQYQVVIDGISTPLLQRKVESALAAIGNPDHEMPIDSTRSEPK